jgi:hypothetical protein
MDGIVTIDASRTPPTSRSVLSDTRRQLAGAREEMILCMANC